MTTSTQARAGAGALRFRLLLLAGGGFALLMGVWTGLARAGVHAPVGPVGAHGIVLVLGFLGTLIGLERAVASARRWAYAAPAATAVSVVWLTAGLPVVGAGVLVTVAGAVCTTVHLVMLAHHREPYLELMAAGTVAWFLAAALWTGGASPVRITPLLAAFLVLTIVGERLELSRLRGPTPASRRRLVAAATVFGSGCVIAVVARPAGLILGGIGLLGQTAWLLRNDVARVTVRRAGLPRFSAVCLLAGYVWLAAGGGLWIALAVGAGGPLIHDAAVHAVFLGFVVSMVMGHAPIVLPALLGVALPLRRSGWVPLVLLHASVAVRVGADLAGSAWLRGWAAHGNVTALLLFVALAAATVARARPRPVSTSPPASVQAVVP